MNHQPFTDIDLKWWKKEHQSPMSLALLARLEAAEVLAQAYANIVPIAFEMNELAKISSVEVDYRAKKILDYEERVNAWRKACGR